MRLLRSGDRSGTDPPPSPSSTDAFNRHRGARSATRSFSLGSQARAPWENHSVAKGRRARTRLSESPRLSARSARLWRSALHVSCSIPSSTGFLRSTGDRNSRPSKKPPRAALSGRSETPPSVRARRPLRVKSHARLKGAGVSKEGPRSFVRAPLWSFDREAVERGGAGGRSPPAFIRPGGWGEAPACVDGQNHPAMRPERQGTMRISRPFETSMSVVLPNVATRSITPCM
jgi:hypothetical protein